MFFDTEPEDTTPSPTTDPALDEAMKELPKDKDAMLNGIQAVPDEEKK